MKPAASEKGSFEKGMIYMLLSATCLAFSFLFLKLVVDEIDYFLLLFLRFFLPLVLIGIVLSVQWKWNLLGDTSSIALQLYRTLCVLVAQYAIVFYMTYNTLLNATVLLNAGPLFIPFLERLFLKHPIGKSTLVGSIVSFIGVLLILQPDSSLFSAISAIGILAALGQAGSQVLYGIRAKSENAFASLFYLFFFSSIVSVVIFLFFGKKDLLERHRVSQDWLFLIFLGLMGLATLGNQYFRGLAYRLSRPSALSPFLYISVFVSGFFDWFIFKQVPTVLTILGASLVIIGGALKVFLRSRILKNKK